MRPNLLFIGIFLSVSACRFELPAPNPPDAALEVIAQQSYLKASNADAGDYFGVSVALSADGSTLAVGATHEDSAATGSGRS